MLVDRKAFNISANGYSIEFFGDSRSFPGDHQFVRAAAQNCDILVLAGIPPLEAPQLNRQEKLAILVELDTECLGLYADEDAAISNIVGFSRWRLGDNAPSDLIELVIQPSTSTEAIAAAHAIFEAAGLTVVQCQDRIGRIVDRLIRPQFNLALNAVDDGLATADDLETALKLGLGYRRGLLHMLHEGGLADHHDVTSALFNAYGLAQYSPPRSAVIAARRRELDPAA